MKQLIFVLFFTLSVFAMESAISIELSPQVKEFMSHLSSQDKKKLNKAIKVGNKFTELHRAGYIFYDPEIEKNWNKDFKPLTVLSGEQITQIWVDNLGDDKDDGFEQITCNKTYLKEIMFDKNITKLTYETLVIGMDNSSDSSTLHFKGYRFIKLDNEYFRLELSLNQTPKIINLNFLTKNSSSVNYKTFSQGINFMLNNEHSRLKELQQLAYEAQILCFLKSIIVAKSPIFRDCNFLLIPFNI